MSELTVVERLALAIKANDAKAIEALADEIHAGKTARHKAELEAINKENEALAGKRGELATAVHTAVVNLKLDKAITALKSWGFTYKVDNADPAQPGVRFVSVSLLTPQAPKTGKGGKGGGKRSDLQGEFDSVATAAEKAELEAAGSPSAKWAVKNRVKKAAIVSGLLKPAR